MGPALIKCGRLDGLRDATLLATPTPHPCPILQPLKVLDSCTLPFSAGLVPGVQAGPRCAGLVPRCAGLVPGVQAGPRYAGLRSVGSHAADDGVRVRGAVNRQAEEWGNGPRAVTVDQLVSWSPGKHGLRQPQTLPPKSATPSSDFGSGASSPELPWELW